MAIAAHNPPPAPAHAAGAHVIVFGNEKGGTGKTTTAMHVAISLMRLGHKVAAIDLDSRQRSFGRYIENRTSFTERHGVPLLTPAIQVVERAKAASLDQAAMEETQRFESALACAKETADYVIIDSPGSDTHLSRLGHSAADTLVTPLNDSFLDFDLLAKIDPETYAVAGPSLYSEFVWECRKRRLMARKPQLDWVVLRNRVSTRQAKNKQRLAKALDTLSSRVGFRLAPGVAERVIFRELFPLGLTLFDLPQKGVNVPLTMSHVAAKQEIRQLLTTLNLPGLAKASA